MHCGVSRSLLQVGNIFGHSTVSMATVFRSISSFFAAKVMLTDHQMQLPYICNTYAVPSRFGKCGYPQPRNRWASTYPRTGSRTSCKHSSYSHEQCQPKNGILESDDAKTQFPFPCHEHEEALFLGESGAMWLLFCKNKCLNSHAMLRVDCGHCATVMSSLFGSWGKSLCLWGCLSCPAPLAVLSEGRVLSYFVFETAARAADSRSCLLIGDVAALVFRVAPLRS